MLLVDKNKIFPNQLIDNNPTECTAIAACDIAGNILNTVFDYDFTYAMTLRLEGSQPTTAGADPYIAMQSAFFYGMLPFAEQDFSSKELGELYAANWKNYSAVDIASALKYAQKGVKCLGSFDEIVSFIAATRTGVSLPLKWYQTFNVPPPSGVLPTPAGQFSYHNVACYGITDDGLLILKPWLGSDFGDHGYVYMSRSTFKAATLPYQYAYGFDPAANRILSIIWLALTRLRLVDAYNSLK